MSTLDRNLPLRSGVAAHPAPREGRRVPAAGRLLLALLARVERGAIVVEKPDGTSRRFGAPRAEPAALSIHDWRMARDTMQRGDVGFAEAYIAGHWDTPDLVRLLTLLAVNQPALERAFYGRRLATLLLRMRHWLNANTRRQARKNIVAHYDLGNDFYRLWLDETMTYSSALFSGQGETLRDAQQNKYASICDRMGLKRGDHVLEIGCGWGGFAEYAIRERGARVTGLTLSHEQHDYAKKRLFEAGLAERGEIVIRDRTNVQDNSILRCTPGARMVLGEDTTIGHNVTMADCTIGNRCLIGIGSVVAPGTVVEDDVFLAAGASTSPGQVLGSGHLYGGQPARVIAPLDDRKRALIRHTISTYCEYAEELARVQKTAATTR